MARLIIVSNRVAVPAEGKDAVSAGGLAVAVKEAFSSYEGLWFGWSGNICDNPSTEPELIAYLGRRCERKAALWAPALGPLYANPLCIPEEL